MGHFKLVLIASLVASAIAGPTGSRVECSTQCNQPEFFKYEIGSTYNYNYDATTTTTLLNPDGTESKIYVTVKAHITPVSSCDIVLTLTDVNLEGSENNAQFSEALIKYPLKFGFNDGQVTEVCGQTQDPTWVVDFKKGILSTWQSSRNKENGLEIVEETDISGVCTTSYVGNEVDEEYQVTKSKKTTMCTHRPRSESLMANVAYTPGSIIQNLPILNSDQECNQTIKNRIVKKAACKDTNTFKPFSVSQHGSSVQSTTNLELDSVVNGGPAIKDFEFQRTSLMFVFDDQDTIDTHGSNKATEVLNALENSIENDIRPEVPALFSQLVEEMKFLNYEQLSQMITKAKNTRSHKFLVDASLLVRTAPSMRIISELIATDQLTTTEVNNWFTSLAFVKNPTSDMLSSVYPSIETVDTQNALLGISTLIHNYCKNKSTCGDETEVIALLRMIESRLGTACRSVTEEDKIKILVTLKALGNAGRWVNAGSILRRCYAEENPMEVRVAALEAWRRAPCSYDRDHLLSAFKDLTQDSELRIAAYLAMMSCPTKQLVDTLKEHLSSEGVNHVGSFVWTHLTNLQESAAPEKQWIRHLIGEELLQKKFKTEALKFSRNYESSFYSNVSNIGAIVESNVIFSSKSFVPRSAMLNLTVDLFGESINLLEVGGRVEGFESFIENFFGPNGYYPEETVAEIIKNLRQERPKAQNTLEEFLEDITDEPEATYYYKMFGNELHYEHLRGSEIFESKKKTSPSFMDMMIEMARKGKVDYSKSKKIIDTKLVHPTISGFLLTLSVNSTATVGMKIDGNFRAKSMKDIDIEGHIHPSAAIELDAVMAIDAYVTKKGIKMTSTLHTSTLVDGKVKVNGGQLVDMKFNMPKDKIEIVNFKSDIFHIDDNKVNKYVPETSENHMCSTKLIRPLGMAMCIQTITPKTNIMGPYGASIFIEKEDTHTEYLFNYEKQPNKINIMFDTPGSKVNRKWNMALNGNTKSVGIEITTPFKSAKGSGSIDLKRNSKALAAELSVDGGNNYKLQFNSKSSGEGNVWEVERSLMVSSEDATLFNMQGKLLFNTPQKKVVTDFSMIGSAIPAVKLHGSYNGLEMDKSAELTIESPVLNLSLDAHYKFNLNELSYGLDVSCSTYKSTPFEIKHKASFKREATNDLTTYSADILLDHSIINNINTNIKAISKVGTNSADSEVSIEVGETVVKFMNEYKKEFSSSDNGVTWTIKQSIKEGENDIMDKTALLYISDTEFKYKTTGKSMNTNSNFDLTWNKNNVVNCEAKLTTPDDGTILDFSVITVDEGYKVKGQFGSEMSFAMNFMNRGMPGKLNLAVDYDYKRLFFETDGKFALIADKNKASLDIQLTRNSEKSFVKALATTTSFKFDTNIYKTLSIDSKLDITSPEKKIQVDLNYEDQLNFLMAGTISMDVISADLSFGEKKYSMLGKIAKESLDFKIQWSPTDIVRAEVKYHTGNPTEWEALLETPFAGWIKQSAKFQFKYTPTEILSQLSVSWKNSQLISLTINGVFENIKSTQITATFVSPFEHFETAKLLFKTDMKSGSYMAEMKMEYGSNIINGKINYHLITSGFEAEATLTTPYTYDFVASIKHKKENMNMLSEIKINVANENIKAIVDTTANNSDNINLSSDILIEGTIIPKVTSNVKLMVTAVKSDILIEGKIGEKKMLLTLDWNKEVSGVSTSYTANVRFLTPVTYPFSLNFAHNVEGKEGFNTNFEMTRFWDTKGVLKAHLEGKMNSKNDIRVSGMMVSPVLRSTIDLKHQIANNALNSKIITTLNNNEIALVATGTVNDLFSISNINLGLTSTYESLDDIKINFDHNKTQEKRTSKLVLKKGTKMLTIDHVLEFYSIKKFSNYIAINGNYKIETDCDLIGTKTFMNNIMWNNNRIELQISKSQATLFTPWTSLITLQYKVEHPRHIFDLTYGNGKQISLIYNKVTLNGKKEVELTLITPYFDKVTIGYRRTLNLDQYFPEMVKLSYGELIDATLDMMFNYRAGDLQLNIKSNSLVYPVDIKTSYNFNGSEKMLKLSVTTDSTYEGILNVSTIQYKYGATLQINTPMKNIVLMFKSDFTGPRYSMKTNLTLDGTVFKVAGTYDQNSLKISSDINEKKGEISVKWLFTQLKGKLGIKFISPLNQIDDMSLDADYDFDNKESKLLFVKADTTINITGTIQKNKIAVESTTTVPGWKNVEASIMFSKSDINIVLLREDRKIELNGNANIKHSIGQATLTVTTPYTGYGNLNLKISYNLNPKTSEITFESSLDDKNVLVFAHANTADFYKPEFNMAIKTPFIQMENLKLQATMDLTSSVKTASIDSMFNKDPFKWNLQLSSEDSKKAELISSVSSSIPDWKSVEISFKYDLTEMPFYFNFIANNEGAEHEFGGKLSCKDREFSVELLTPITNWKKIELSGNYEILNDSFKLTSHIFKNTEAYAFSTFVIYSNENLHFDLVLDAPIPGPPMIKLLCDVENNNAFKKVNLDLTINETKHSISIDTSLARKKGYFILSTALPLIESGIFKVNGKYNFIEDVKSAELFIENGNIQENVTFKINVNNNAVDITIKSSIDGFELIELKGDYSKTYAKHSTFGSLTINNDIKYEFDGFIHLKNKVFDISLKSPIPNIETIKATGKIRENRVDLDIETSYTNYKFGVEYKLEPENVYLKIKTPMRSIRTVSLGGKYSLTKTGGTVEGYIQRNSQKFVMKSNIDLTPMKSKVNIEAESLKDNKKIGIDLSYDILTQKKHAEVILVLNDLIKTVSIEGKYDINYGFLKIKTPFYGYETNEIEYSLQLNKQQKTMDATLKLSKNNDIFAFGINGEIGENNLNIVFRTPFTSYETLSVRGKINFDNKFGKAIIDIGKLRFSVDISYSIKDLSFKIVTPYESYKQLSAGAKYTWSENNKMAHFTVGHNDINYEMLFTFLLGSRSSEITVKGSTPFANIRTLGVSFKYDFDNIDELIKTEATLNDVEYKCLFGGYVTEKILYGKFDMSSPITGLRDITLKGKIDLANEDKVLELSLKKENDEKAIYITGKLIGGSFDLSMKTPIYGLENFKTFASFSRTKRSISMGMMNDAASASIVANFNSLHVVVNTPYKNAKEVTLDVTKNNKGVVELHWKRNQYYIDFKAVPEGKKKELALTIKSEIPGWQFLAMIGKLDNEEIEAYLSGQRNSEKMVIQGSGNLGKKSGSIKVKAETPFNDYKVVDIDFKYHTKSRSYSLAAKSSSSNFNIFIEKKSNFKANIFIPKPDTPTEVDIDLQLVKGHIYIKSRFPAVRDFKYDYEVKVEANIEAHSSIELNGIKHFDLEFKNEGNGNVHLKIEGQRTGHKSKLHYHREGWSSAMFHFERDGHEFKIDVKGSGSLPSKGKIDVTIFNSFRETPKTINIKIDLDRTTKPKHLKVELVSSRSGLYIFDLKYNADLSKIKTGDFELHVTTPQRDNARWKNLSGSWNLLKSNKAKFQLDVSGTKYNAEGKFGIKESNIILKSNNPKVDNIFINWKFDKSPPKRDYYVKIGRESSYFMFKLNGEIHSISSADLSLGLRLPLVMSDDFESTFKWNKGGDGKVTGSGSFSYAKYKGNHVLEKFIRNAATRSAEFKFKMTSNVPNFNELTIEGNYNFDHKAKVYLKIKWDADQILVDFNLENLATLYSNNKSEITLPGGKKLIISIGHDFRDSLSRSINLKIKLGARETRLEAKWKKNKELTTLDGSVNIHSDLLRSDVDISFKYDFRDFRNALAEIHYKRNNNKHVDLKFERKKTDTSLHTELAFNSHFSKIPDARLYVDGTFKKKVNVDGGIELGSRKIHFNLAVDKSEAKIVLHTPFPDFNEVKATLTYNITDKKNKTVKFVYQRGSKQINFDLNLSIPNKKSGSLNVSLTTPFDVIKTLTLKGEWKNKKASVKYNRNGIEYSFEGKADIKATQSSFDIQFTPQQGQPVKIEFEYDVKDFIEGNLHSKKQIVELKLQMFGESFEFDIEGIRDTENLKIDVTTRSSYDKLSNINVDIQSQRKDNGRHIEIDLKVNEFELEGDIDYEKKPNGYYVKCKLESTLTPLPGLIFGLGRDGDERIVTVGLGDNREITVSFKGKNNFKDGFSGKVELPARNLMNIQYDVDYKFLSADEIKINLHINYGDGRELKAEALYNSDGVKARLTSPFGSHSLRARRSISNNEFMTDIGYNDYSVTLKGKYNAYNKRGLIVNGQLFGTPFKFDTFYYNEGKQYVEGKIMIESPYFKFEKIGGVFTWSNKNKHINGQLEMNLPSYVAPKLMASVDFKTDKNIVGEAQVNMFNEIYSLKIQTDSPLKDNAHVNIEVITPYHVIGKITLTGNVLLQLGKNIYVDLAVEHPYGISNIMFKNEFTKRKINSELVFNCGYSNIHHDIILVLQRKQNGVSTELVINKQKISFDFELKNKIFKFTLNNDWQFCTHHLQTLNANINYSSISDMTVETMLKLNDKTHDFVIGLNIDGKKINGKLEITSDLLAAPRKLNFSLFVPQVVYNKFELDFMLETTEKHLLKINYEKTDGVTVNIEADSSLSNKMAVKLNVLPKNIDIVVSTTKGNHEFKANYDLKKDEAHANLKFTSTILNINYDFTFMTLFEENVKKIDLSFLENDFTHKLVIDMINKNSAIKVKFDVETYLLHIDAFNVDAMITFIDGIKIDFMMLLAGDKNEIKFDLNKKTRTLTTSINSPIMEIGSVKAEGSVTGSTLEDTRINFILARNSDKISSDIKVMFMSSDNMEFTININTPITKYNNLKFGGLYKKDQATKIKLYGDNPIFFHIEGEFGNKDLEFYSLINVETPFDNLKKMAGKMLLPLDKLAPKVSMMINDKKYGLDGEYYHIDYTRFFKLNFQYEDSIQHFSTSVRNKAPYEATVMAATEKHMKMYHLRADSSFLSYYY